MRNIQLLFLILILSLIIPCLVFAQKEGPQVEYQGVGDIVGGAPGSQQQAGQGEQLTITTYYPSPYGVYKTVRLFPTSDCATVTPCNNGELCTNQANDLYMCKDSFWQIVGGETFWQGSVSGDINNRNTGNVGIGIINPAQKLHVAGTTQMMGFKMPTGADTTDMVLVSDVNGVGTWKKLNEINTFIQTNCNGLFTVDVDSTGKLVCGEDQGGGGSTSGCTSAINTITGNTGISASTTGTACAKSTSIGLNVDTSSADCKQTTDGKVYWNGSKLVCDKDRSGIEIYRVPEASSTVGTVSSACPSGYQVVGCGGKSSGCLREVSPWGNGCRVSGGSGSDSVSVWTICVK